MQKTFIIFALIVWSSTVSAQMKVRDLQTINDEPVGSAQIQQNSAATANFVELNRLGVQKALVEKNYKEASVFFSKAIEAAPDCFKCKFNLGRSLLALEKPDEAIKIFDELAAVSRNDAELLGSLGEAYNMKGLYQESIPYFQKAAKINPKDAITLTNYAVSLTMLQKHKDALENLEKAIKLKPDFPEAYSNRGYSLYFLGRYKDALESLRIAEKLNPNIAQVYNNLGVVLDKLGKKKEAKSHYEKAVALKADYGEALCNLALSNLEEGNREAAYQQLKTLEKVNFRLAGQLRDVLWGKYVVDASQVKEKD